MAAGSIEQWAGLFKAYIERFFEYVNSCKSATVA
jgi:hypothetical protein